MSQNRASDTLDMDYINSLPQPLIGVELNATEWPVYDIDVSIGILRIDVCGRLNVMAIADFTKFRDSSGVEHRVEGFYIDAIPEERIFINGATK
jgi:hypothetical protein